MCEDRPKVQLDHFQRLKEQVPQLAIIVVERKNVAGLGVLRKVFAVSLKRNCIPSKAVVVDRAQKRGKIKGVDVNNKTSPLKERDLLCNRLERLLIDRLFHKEKNRRIFASRLATERRGGRDVHIISYLAFADKGVVETDSRRWAT